MLQVHILQRLLNGINLYNMKKYEVTMKEVGSDHPITSFFCGDVSEHYLIDHYGLNENYIEWYTIKKL